MSDDLIKRLLDYDHIDAWQAAARIEELEERTKELTLQLLAAHGQASDALDKLAKAMEALRKIADAYDINWHAGVLARAVLAELEGGE